MKKLLLIFSMFMLFSTTVFASVWFQFNVGFGMGGGLYNNIEMKRTYETVWPNKPVPATKEVSDKGVFSLFWPVQLGMGYEYGSILLDVTLGIVYPLDGDVDSELYFADTDSGVRFRFQVGVLKEFRIEYFTLGLGAGYDLRTSDLYVRVVPTYKNKGLKVPLFIDFYIPTSGNGNKNTGLDFDIGLAVMYSLG